MGPKSGSGGRGPRGGAAALAAPAVRRGAVATPDFDSVYERFFEFVWRTTRRLGVPDRHLDDAVQDTFVIVHRKLPEFSGRSAIKTWIYGIARRVARDHRRRARRKPLGQPFDDDIGDARAADPRRAAEAREASAVVGALLAELGGAKREVFILAELEEMPAPAIAEALGESTNTIYSRLRAARRDFERALRRHRAREGKR